MQQKNVDQILNRLNEKLSRYCPKSSSPLPNYFTFADDSAVSIYKNTQTLISEECVPHVIIPTFNQSDMRAELQSQKKIISKLKDSNEKLLSEVEYLQKRVQKLERRASSQSLQKKKLPSRRSSKNEIQSSFYSNTLLPKLKKKTRKRK